MKRYVIFSGVNGAGKTTLYHTNPKFHDLPRINLDEIVREEGDWKNPEDVIRAGRKAIALQREYLRQGISFNQETTLCGHSILKSIEQARESGYYIEIYFVGLESPELARERVKQRIEAGGHGVPDADIERRFYEAQKNLIALIPFCNRVELFDNTDSFRQVAILEFGQCIDQDENLLEWCRNLLGELERKK